MAPNGIHIARAAVVKVAQILSRQRIAVTQRGDLAYCEADDDGNPTRINLPFLPDGASERVLRATQGYLDHEVGHALFTDFASVREAGEESALLKMLHNLVEDTLIERRMATRFRGSAYNLEETRRFVLDEHVTPALERMQEERAAPEDLFSLLLMPVARAWSGQQIMADYMDDKWRLVARHTALFADLVERFATVKDSWDALALARDMVARLERGAPEAYARMLAQAEAAEAALRAAAEASIILDGAAADAEADGPMLFERALSKALARAIDSERDDAEWRAFTTDFDRIEPLPLGGRDWSEDLARMQREIETTVGPMARSIERMVAAQKQAHWLGGRRRGRLHSAALHRAPQGDARLFRQRVETRARNAAVSLVVDLSGSMSGRRVWIACAAALALSESLSRVGVAHEAIGFTTLDTSAALDKSAMAELRRAEASQRAQRKRSRGARNRARRMSAAFSRHEPLYLPVLKGFDERLGPQTRLRFAAAAGRNNLLRNNIDHESIRQAGLRLAARDEPRRVMIVFSDGEPAFDGDVIAAQRLLGQEVASLERAGMEVYGVGVESAAVEAHYPRHSVIEQVEDLPDALMRLMRAALS